MQEEKNAILHVGKELLNTSFMTLAAIGGATGNAWLAGTATAIPAALSIADIFTMLRARHSDIALMLPVPPWWNGDLASWQAVCSSIEHNLPAIIQEVSDQIQHMQQVPTPALVHQYFMDALVRHLPGWEVQPQDRNMIAGYVTSPLLEKSAEVLKPTIDTVRNDVLAQQLTKVVDMLNKAGTLSEPLPSTAVSTTTIQPIISSPHVLSNSSVVASLLEQKRRQGAYDVYICFAEQDRQEVIYIGQQLKIRGILPWFDDREARPGMLQGAVQDQLIQKIPVAAICIGQHVISGKLERQMYAFLSQYDNRGCIVIPVILASTSPQIELRPYIGDFVPVDFRDADSKPMSRLIWGITGIRPDELDN